MIDHLTITVSDLRATRAFYEKTLGTLGYSTRMEFGEMFGMGDERKPYLWFKDGPVATTPQHLAFVAPSRAHVDAFHAAALEMGAKDDGAPGIREHYHPDYYGAFVIDPLNGHPIEAVCHLAPGSAVKKAASKRRRKSRRRRRRSRKSRRRRSQSADGLPERRL